ncbi:MAG: ribulose-phosphate 3-epimerase [Sedimentisphaerales bacterium]|nr:ribulose-phosphate 3-epimerase [Sedimentisphaerales bacterium]
MSNYLPKPGTIEICPSILSADFAHLADHVAQVANEIRILHLDVMDGHFVPNLTFGPVLVKWLRGCFPKLFFDAHLMITDAPQYAPQFVKAGADGITFHLEAVNDPHAMIRQIRQLNVAAGVSIKPGTPVQALSPIIADVDMVLLMSVEPGFGGQGFLPQSIERCRELKKMLRKDQWLQVDGGIDPTTTPLITAAGADMLVAGSAVFGRPDPAAACRTIRDAARSYQP